MTNVQMSVVGSKLYIEIDLSQEHGVSATGKSMLVASSHGNKQIEGADGVFMGLNIYKPLRTYTKKEL